MTHSTETPGRDGRSKARGLAPANYTLAGGKICTSSHLRGDVCDVRVYGAPAGAALYVAPYGYAPAVA